MNKIFKVIWSKSKQCYVVVSEIAKNKTGKKKIVVAGIFAALAMVSSVQDVSAVTGSGGTNNFSNSGSGASFKEGEGLAIGTNATVANGNTNTVAIGVSSEARGSSSFAASGGTTAAGKAGQVAIGWSSTDGTGAVAIGGTTDTAGVRDTRATGTSAVALGIKSAATGNNAFAASGGNATGESATAIGSNAIASGRGGVAVGWNAESAVNAVGIGFNAKAKSNNTVAIGVEANSDNGIGDNSSSVSIGVKTRAREVGSMAMGVSADASGKYSIALGSGNVSGDYTATANYPKATGEKSIAIGYNSNSSNTGATAIGAGATASGADSFAGGSGTAGGNSSIAIGKGASITTPTAGTTVGGQDSIAMGTGATANQHSSVTIGAGSTSDGVRNITIGPKASASGVDSIAIGNGGVGGDKNNTGVGGNGNTYTINVNDISTNVYYGVKSVDNGSIAFGNRANAAKGGLAIGTVSIADGGIAVGQSVLSKNGVAMGSAVSATVANAVAMGSTAEASSIGAVAIGGYSATDKTKAQGNNALAIGASAVTNGSETIAIGKSANASNANAVAVGKNANASIANSVAIGSDSTTDTNATRQANTTINGITYNFAGATSDAGMQVSVGAAGKERQIKNVAAGEVSATSTDAINGSQLFAVASQIKPIQYFAVNSSVAGNKDNSGAIGSDSVAIGPKAKAQAVSSIALGNNATAAGGNSIAIGNTSSATDKQSPISIGYGATANGDFSIAIGGGDNNTNYGATANGVGGTSLGGKTKTTGGNFQTAVGFGATTTAQNASAFGYNATTSVEGGVALGFNSSSTTGVNKGYNPNDNRTNKYDGLKNNVLTSTTGAIAVGNGSTVTRQITGLAAGTKDTDAVNVAQLKSVNLAFKGNVGSGDVNLATNDSDKKLTIQGDRTYITTNASGNTLTISANKKDINVTNGTARADAGMADAKNVAEAINKAVSQNAYTWNLTADNDTAGSRATINKEGTVKFSGDSNITVARNNNTITTSLNKSIIVNSVKANNNVTVGTNKITLDGTTGAVTGKAFTGDSFTAGNNVLTNTTLQIGSPAGGNNVSITRDGLIAKAGTKTVKFATNGIDAGGQQITNVSSGGNVGTNAANITDVKNRVSDVTLNLDTNSKTGTVKLSESPLKVIGANGIRTDLVGTNNGSLVVGLDSNTVNATTKGIGLTGDTGSTGFKYLKDGDASFKVAGDGKLVTTKASATGVQVAVDTAKVKDLAVEAVTVSKANTADNPITVTPTAGTNSKDYAIGIDTTKLASKTDLTYRANNDADANAQKVSLAKGLNFVNGDNTVATVAADGKVSYDLNAATKTKVDESATAVARNISLGADSGTASSQSLKDGDVAFNVKGATGDYVSTNMNGNTVEVSTKRATINSDANTGAASVTGNDGLATAKNVADAINKAADAAKAGSAWNVSTNGDASTKVSGGDTVDFTGDNNITVDRNNKTISTSLNKNLTDMKSISLGNARGETIFLNGRDGSIQANKAEFKDNVGAGSTITSDQLSFTNGATGANEATTAIALDTVSIQSGPNGSALTSKYLMFSDEDGNNAEGSAKGMAFQDADGKMVQFSLDEIKAGGNKIQEVAEGTADTDAVNVKQLKDTVASQTLTYRANTATDADAKSVKLSKGLDFVDGTTTVATVDNDGKVSFDLNTATKTKIDDSATAVARNISLGADSGTASSQSLKDGDVAFNVKGATGDLVSTKMNGNTVEISTKRAAITSDANTGAASVTGDDGLATSKNVADAINKAADAAKAGAAWNLTTNSSTTDKITVQGGDTVDLINGDNILITQDSTDKKKITVATKKDLTVDSITAGNTVMNTSGLTNGTTAITGTGITTDKVTVGGISIDKTDGINGGNKTITNVASGGTTDTNAANIGDVKQAVANLSQNLNITDGTNNGTIDLKNQKLNVAGTNGVTATVNGQTVTVGLDDNTVNATTKGIGLTGDTGSTGNKYLKDGDVSFAVVGDGNLVSTSATATGVKVTVDAAKVKDLAVDAVTVSKDAQADNPITVTPTAGTNSKDYAIGIDTTKLAGKTDLTYRANNDTDANAQKVSLAKGLNFINGDTTVATVAADGKVSYDINTATKTKINDAATAVARNISLGADSGTASSQSLKDNDVAFNVKGATGDYISTKMNGDTVEVSTKHATINSDAAGTASVTGNDGLATAKNVADAINKAASQAKDGAAWKLSANGDTPTTVAGGDTVDFTGDNNITVTQTGKNIATILNKDLKDLSTISLTNLRGESIFLDGGDGTIKAYKAEFKDNNGAGSSINSDILRFTNGATGANAVETALSLDVLSIQAGPNNSALTSRDLTFLDEDKNTSYQSAQGIVFQSAAGKTIQFTLDEINAGGNKIKEVAEGTDDTDAVNVKQLKDTVASQTLTYRANTAADTDAKSVKLSKGLDFVDGTMTKATVDNDGKVTFDINDDTKTKINDAAAAVSRKVSLGADSGTTSSQSLKDGDVAFNVKGATGDFISTKMNGDTVEVSTKRATIDSNATTGVASVTGDDGLATAKNVADAINKAAKASTDAINLKFAGDTNTSAGVVNLKDDTLGIKGDGKYVTTDADGKNLTVKVSEAEVKKSAVSAVTVSTDTTDADNPLTVTGTPSADGTTKDYKVTIDGTKVATKTKLSYKANDGTAKQVSLADGLNFKDGTLTTATIDDAGVVKYDVKTAAITAGTDGTITGPATDGVATAKNVADAINAAKKASKTEITANAGEAANATKGNVTLTSTTAVDGHTIYDVKLNDKVTLGTGTNAVTIDGTAGKATIGSSIVDGVNNTFTTGGTKAVTLDGATGTITGKTANIGGVTVNGTANTIGGLSNTTWNGTAVSGRAATEDQLKAATGATTLKFTGDVATNTGSVNLKDDTFGIKGDGKYISTDVNGKNVNLTVSEAEVKKSAVAAVTVSTDTTDANNPLTVTPTTSADGTTKDYKVTIDGTKIANKTNVSYKANGGTAKQVSLADGLNFKNGTLTTASIDDAGVVKYDVNTAAITAGADGTITGPTTDGVATAKNVADAINTAKKASKTEITANTGEAANATKGNVTLTSTTAADGHTIYDVKLNDKVTLGSGANAVTVDGTAGKAIIGTAVVNGVANTITTGGANAVTLDGATAKVTAGVTTVDGTTGTITTGGTNSIKVDGATGTVTGLTNKDWTPGITKAVTGRAATEDQLQKVADAASSQTWNITADKTGTTGAQTGTKKNATVGKDETVELVAGDNLTINQNERKFTYSLNKDLAGLTSVSVGTGTTETIKLDGATGKITAKNAVIGGVTVDGDNSHVTGLSNTTWNGTVITGRAATEDQLKAVADTAKATTDAVNLKFSGDTNTSAGVVNLKDDTFNIVGDGKYVSTDANGKNLTVKVSEAEVKKSAVAAVTVSTDTTDANNPISVTPTTSADGTTKDYKVTIDGTKIANKTNLSYKANDGTAKQVSLADGLNFKNGTLTTASIDDAGVVKYDVNTAAITAGTDGTITSPTTDGVATAKNVADAINAAKKAAKTEITANAGEAANATTSNVTLTSTTAADGHTIYDVKLNDKVTLGTGANAVTVDGTTGAITGKTATIGGVTVNGTANTIGGLSNTTWNGTATTGRAATEDQLKAVADAAGSQTWEITADKKAGTTGAQTGTKKDAKVGKDDKVQLIAGENMTVNQNERDFTFTLNKDLVKMNSATFLGTGSNTTVITGNSITQTAGTQTNTSTAAGNTIANGTKSTETTAAGQVIKDGNKSNKSTVDSNVIDDGNGNKNTSNATSNTITDGTNTTEVTASTVTIKDNAGNSTVITKDTITTGTGANKVTVDGTAGKVTAGTAVIDGVNNSIITGGAKTIKLDGAAGTVTGLTNKTWTPGVTKAVSGRAATEDQLQQVSDAVGAGWKVNTGTVAGSSGVSNGADSTKVSSGEEVKLQAGDNLIIDQNGKTVSYSLNKDLTKMNSATFEATGGKTTVIKGDSIVQTDGGKTNTSNAAGNTVVDGNKSTATTAAGTTITDGAKTNTSTADKNVINDGAGNTNVSNATSNTLKNAAGDETKADAKGVTVKDAAGNNATFTKDGITITKTGKDTVSLTSNGLDNGKNKIVNVAAGVANTDAVNVGQLKEYSAKSTTELTANNSETAGNTKGNIVLTKTTAADGHTIYDNKLNDKITLGAADPTKAVTVDGTAGTITVADKITLNGKDGKAGIGTVGIDGKDGIITTGGTNSVKVDGSTGTVTGLTNKTWTPGSIVSGRAATEDQLKEAVANSGWKATVDKEGSGQSTVVGTSPEKIKAEETVTFKAGNNMMVTQTGKSISYAVNPELTDMKSATFKDAAGNTTVTNSNGITITPGSANPTNPHAGPVSLTKDGLNNGNNQIKGVAPGTDPTDAVNVSQLNASNANTSQAINQIAGEVQHVGAHAAAMAALKPIQYDPLEPTQVMAGVGNYRGETAAALGLAHYTNENTMFNVGVSVGGNHNMVNAGVTHKFGYSPEKKNIPDRYKAGPISSVYVMQDEVSSLKKENAEQKYVIADQAARLTTLEAENEQQRRELAETKQGLDDLKAAVDKLLASKG